MCNDYSCLVTQSRQVIWKRGISSHDKLETMFKNDYPELQSERRFVKVEITPDKGYLYPEKPWSFQVDEEIIPSWFTDEHKLSAKRAHRQWKKEVYSFINLEEARNPINPLAKAHKPTKADIELLKQWASVGDSVRDSVWASVGDSVGDSVRDSVWASVGDSVRDSVRDSVWDSVRDSVRDSVWASVRASVGDSVRDSVRAYTGSLFTIWNGEYKFTPAVELWKRGLVASYDRKTWRLHTGPKAKIVYEWTPDK